MNIKLGYGTGFQYAEVPDKNIIKILEPNAKAGEAGRTLEPNANTGEPDENIKPDTKGSDTGRKLEPNANTGEPDENLKPDTKGSDTGRNLEPNTKRGEAGKISVPNTANGEATEQCGEHDRGKRPLVDATCASTLMVQKDLEISGQRAEDTKMASTSTAIYTKIVKQAHANPIGTACPGEIVKQAHANPIGTACPGEIVKLALANPIGTARLGEIVKPSEKIVIITSDITRPMPTAEVLPHVLDELYGAGAKPEDITLLFALGSHRHHTDEERLKLAGERAIDEIRCIDSDPTDCVHLGTTKRGIPVDITRVVAEADRRICLGNIEYHYFAGYSGGIKALMPGASTPRAIQINHSMMVDENACAGKLNGNPLREDLEEANRFCPIDFIVNVVLDEHKKIAAAFAGDVVRAHREGCRFLDSMYRCEIPRRADIVIVSQGGAPKDLNLYQTQKALDNAKHVVKDGGTIILVGSCREGLGNKTFEEWITSAKSSRDLIKRVREDFKLGGHKAAAIAMVMERATIKLVSEMDREFVSSMFFEPYDNLQDAVDDAIEEHSTKMSRDDISIIIMPYGGSTLPCIKTVGE